MATSGLVSIIIPSRNEKYLQRTIQDLLEKAKGEVQIISVLDGYWPAPDEIIEDPRVVYLHFGEARGMRNAINSAVAIAKGEYLLKSDAHCMFAEGYDQALKVDCRDNWITVPRRYALDPEKWDREDNPKYPIDYMYLSKDFHGEPWTEKNRDESLKNTPIDDLMSAQGSCWFMKRDYYYELELLDEENYGKFWNEFQEIGLKCWLSGGEVKVNKNTWYAHWHKPKEVGRGYSLRDAEQEKALATLDKWKEFGKAWHKQTLPLSWLFDKFAPTPK